jgi:hypothetical protein
MTRSRTDEVYRYYRQMPDLVKIIITEHVRECCARNVETRFASSSEE